MKTTTAHSGSASLVGCTIAPAMAVPQALVLAESFRKFHPDAEFVILPLGQHPNLADGSSATIFPFSELGLAKGEEWRLPMLFEIQEVISLLKPHLLERLLQRGAGTVAWFEYTTLLFAALAEQELPDGKNAIVASEAIDNEFGDYGRSFIAVRSGAESSVRSWAERLQNETSVARPENQPRGPVLEPLFDSVPHALIRTPGFAISYWNLDPESLTMSPRGYEIGGHPLRSFDFRGYDPAKPHLLSKYLGLEPRILLSEHPALAKLGDEYRDKVVRICAGQDQANAPLPGFLPSGLRLDPRMLRVYRDALGEWRAGKEAEPPSPFGPEGEEGFLKWLNEPVGQTRKMVTRYMLAVRADRPDIEKAFPDPLGADAAGFRNWYLRFGLQELEISAAFVPADAKLRSQAGESVVSLASNLEPVNVAGYFRAELGLGVAARSLLSALDAAGIPFNTISFDATENRQSHPFAERLVENSTADVNLVCVNPDQLAAFAEQTGPELRHGRYTIGVWFWEVEDFPRQFHGAFNYVDEVWVASDFMRETFRKVSPKPVFKFPLPVLTPQIDPALSRPDLGLPDRFVFLFSFDLLSVLERKNPLGLIKAFTTAFPSEEGATLVIKMINGDKRLMEMEKLRYASRGRSDIILLDGYLSQIENHTLTALADCYVSLHRSEGFGLTIAEAMALGKPAIATGYSGNREFMTAENSYLCPSVRCLVGPEREPYPADSYWSEPDLNAAATLLRRVYECRDEARARGLRGAQDIQAFHSPAVAGRVIRDRLATIRRRRTSASATASRGILEDRIEELEAENAKLRGRVTG
jgi:glycosyltransferase involved in cell wall biosynthesis